MRTTESSKEGAGSLKRRELIILRVHSVVAISGLGGHALGSFKERSGEHMWLRDALPYDLKGEATERHMARVMTYGYGSAVAESQSTDNLEDFATAFHHSLLPLASSAQIKPIIFVAHSLGGLVLKQVRPLPLLCCCWLMCSVDAHYSGQVGTRG